MRLIFDLEANGLLKPTPDTPKVDRLHCMVIKDLDTKEVFRFRPEDVPKGLKMLMEAELVVGHNIIGYDLLAANMVYPWFKIDHSRVVDTLVLSRLLFPNMLDQDYLRKNNVIPGKMMGSHSLKSWGYRLGVHKIEYEGGWAEFTEKMLEYNVGDVETNEAVYYHLIAKTLDPRASLLEHGVAFVTSRQEVTGFPFDYAKAEALAQRLIKEINELEEQLKLTFKPWYEPDGEVKRSPYDTSEKDLALPGLEQKGWWGYRTAPVMVPECNRDGFPKLKKDGTPKMREKTEFRGYKFQKLKYIEFNPNSNQHIIKRLRHLFGWVHVSTEVTDSGQPKIDDTILNRLPYPEAKLLARFKMLQKRLGLLQGADNEKGWLNVYRDGRVFGEIIANGAVTGRGTHKIIANIPRVTTPYGPELRELFMASAGRVQVGIDVSGLELRMLAHFLAKFDYGAYGLSVCEGDIHTLNQIAAGLTTRDQAKTFIYAFLYGAGDVKIGSIACPAATEAVQRKEGKKLKAQFVAKTPGLDKLLKAVKAASKRGFLLGLDGRQVHIRSDHAALNFLLQSAGSLICKQWMVLLDAEIEAKGWRHLVDQLIWYHDELQFDVDPGIADDFGKLAVSVIPKAGEYFGIRVPLTGEYKVGRNWRECH